MNTSDQTENNSETDDDIDLNLDLPKKTELETLKERAVSMGIRFSGNIGLTKLKQKIEDAMAGKPATSDTPQQEEEPLSTKPKAESKQQMRERLIKEQTVLVRCTIYNLNPSKRDLQGEIVTIGNKFIGTIRKFIPFGEATDNGFHIPMIIYNELKARKFQSVSTKRIKGQIEVNTRMVPEYNIEVLPALTRKELDELAIQQNAAERLGA